MTAATYLPGKTIAECAAFYTGKLGWGIVSIQRGSKIPEHEGWNKPGGYVTSSAEAMKVWGRGQNMGLLLGASGSATFDVDAPEYARIALAAVGVDLDAVLMNAIRINGNPAKAKAIYRVPAGSDLQTRKLVWPPREPGGKKATVVFELRAGAVQDLLPPSIHPDTKQPYTWNVEFWENGGITELDPVLLPLWQEWDKFRPLLENACPWKPEAPPAETTRITREYSTSADWDDVRKEIRRRVPLEGLLVEMGVESRGNGKYLCPFHPEKNPSFWTFDSTQGYKLWACAHGSAPVGYTTSSGNVVGDVLDIFQFKEGLRSPGEATATLARREGIALPGGHQPAAAAGTTPAVDSAEPIYTAGDLPTATTAAWRAIERKNIPPFMFRYGAVAVRLGVDDTDRPMFDVLTGDKMRHVVARVAPWKTRRLDKNTGAMVERDVPPPIDVIRDILATPSDKMPIPPVSAIVEVPTFSADGPLCDKPGYNAANRTFYAPPSGVAIPAIPMIPTEPDVRRARDLLMEPFLEVPFQGDADLAHTLALTIVPYVREIIGAGSPIHLFDAPIHGSGKTLVAKAALKPAFGEIMFVAQADDDELRKRITSLANAGRPVFFLDNVTRPLSSATLAMALTSPTWTDRILGKSVEVSVPNRMVFVVTGNNVILSGELARRCVRVRIDPNTDQPWLRNGFRIPNMEEWITVNRGRLVAAALTLIRAWINDGMVPWPGRPLGSFESWSRVVGGILDRAGVGGFLENLDALYEDADVENAVWREFVTAWWGQHQDTKVGAATLFPIAEKIDGLDLGKSPTEKGQRTALGAKLRSKRNSVVADYKITPAGTINRASLWRLIPTKREAL